MKQLREQIKFLDNYIAELEDDMRKCEAESGLHQCFKRRRDGLVKVRATMQRFANIGNLLFNDVI